jgi:hypothetical protein
MNFFFLKTKNGKGKLLTLFDCIYIIGWRFVLDSYFLSVEVVSYRKLSAESESVIRIWKLWEENGVLIVCIILCLFQWDITGKWLAVVVVAFQVYIL